MTFAERWERFQAQRKRHLLEALTCRLRGHGRPLHVPEIIPEFYSSNAAVGRCEQARCEVCGAVRWWKLGEA